MNQSLELHQVAAEFVAARREARALPTYPGKRPEALSQAYNIQNHALSLDGRRVVGWKVGKINPPDDTLLGCNRLAGPIFADSLVFVAEGEVPDMPVYVGGFAAAEAEILLHLAPHWDGRVPTNDEETKAIIDEIRFGLEIASSPYPDINADGPCVTVSDFGNNMGSVLGPRLAGWREVDLCAINIRTFVDGAPDGEATAASMLDGPYGAVRFLLANLSERGISVSDGLWVSSGAITGVIPVEPGQSFTARFGDYGEVGCRIIPAKARA